MSTKKVGGSTPTQAATKDYSNLDLKAHAAPEHTRVDHVVPAYSGTRGAFIDLLKSGTGGDAPVDRNEPKVWGETQVGDRTVDGFAKADFGAGVNGDGELYAHHSAGDILNRESGGLRVRLLDGKLQGVFGKGGLKEFGLQDVPLWTPAGEPDIFRDFANLVPEAKPQFIPRETNPQDTDDGGGGRDNDINEPRDHGAPDAPDDKGDEKPAGHSGVGNNESQRGGDEKPKEEQKSDDKQGQGGTSKSEPKKEEPKKEEPKKEAPKKEAPKKEAPPKKDGGNDDSKEGPGSEPLVLPGPDDMTAPRGFTFKTPSFWAGTKLDKQKPSPNEAGKPRPEESNPAPNEQPAAGADTNRRPRQVPADPTGDGESNASIRRRGAQVLADRLNKGITPETSRPRDSQPAGGDTGPIGPRNPPT